MTLVKLMLAGELVFDELPLFERSGSKPVLVVFISNRVQSRGKLRLYTWGMFVYVMTVCMSYS